MFKIYFIKILELKKLLLQWTVYFTPEHHSLFSWELFDLYFFILTRPVRTFLLDLFSLLFEIVGVQWAGG